MSNLPENWSTEILNTFREPGDFRYQLIYDAGTSLGIEPPPFEIETVLDNLPTGYMEVSKKCMFTDNVLTMVGDGLWVLDGTCAPMFKDNVYSTTYSRNSWKPDLPATWDIVCLDERYWETGISAVPNHSRKVSIVWDSKFGAHPTNFVLQGFNDLGYDENFNPLREIVWTIEVTDNDKATSIVDISQYADTTYDSLLITANDWSLEGRTFPTISGVYLGLSEDSVFTEKQLLNANKSSSVDLYSNSLSTGNISLEIGTIGVERDVDSDMLLSEVIPENSRIYVQYGQTYADKGVRYLSEESYSVSRYEAPSDTQSVKIKGVSALETETNIFKFNTIAKGLNKAFENTDSMYEVDLPLYMIPVMMQPTAKTEINGAMNFPKELYEGNLTTRTLGALKKNTPVNQALQYLSQLLQAVLYTNSQTNMIACTKLDDILLQEAPLLDTNATVDYPAITREKNINRIDIKLYNADIWNWHLMYSGTLELRLASGNTTSDSVSEPYVFIRLEDGREFDYDERSSVVINVWYTYEDGHTKYCEIKDKNVGYSSVSFRPVIDFIHEVDVDSETARFSVDIWGCEGPPTFMEYEFTNDTLEPLEFEFEWDKPRRGIQILFNEAESYEPGSVNINGGAYYARVAFTPAKVHTENSPGKIIIKGLETKFTNQTVTYWDNSKNEAGETLTIDNPLISNMTLLKRVGSYIKKLISSRKRYKIKYLGDPAKVATQLVNLQTGLEDVNPFIITKALLDYNGGYSGTLEGRTV